MEELLKVFVGIVAAVVISFIALVAVDMEVARRDYNKNISQCKQIDGCLFDHNCNKYNRMIMEECNE